MSKNIAALILVSATFLTPFKDAYADEQSGKACSLLTEVDDAGQIIWSSSADAAELVADAQSLEISAEDYQALCAGEEIVQEAASDEAAEEEQESTEVASEDVDLEAEAEESIMSSAGVLAPLAGLGLAGGGGGGGGSSSSSSTFLDESTTYTYDANLDATWVARQEYKNSIYGAGNFNGTASTINPYTLVGVNNAYARGLSGTGKVVAVYDTDYHSGTHLEMAVKNSAGKITNDGSLTTGSDATTWHGIHVAGTIAADYNSNNSNFTSGAFGDNRDYGMMGVAYNASLHLSDFADTSVYSTSATRIAGAVDAAKAKSAIAQNNSWGWGNCQTGVGCITIDELVTYQSNNGTSDSASISGVIGGSASEWASMITAYEGFKTSGLVVFANGNDYNSANAGLQAGLPVVATELADAWLTVGNLNITGNTISAANMTRIGNACGQAAEFCIFADGTDIWSSTGDTNNSTNNEYSTYTGSSMAAPIVSGAVALLSEAFPNHTPAQLQDRILASANNDFFTATGTTSFVNGITHGYNSEFGHGLLDLATALGPVSTSSIIVPIEGFGILNQRYGNIETARRFTVAATSLKLGAAFGDSIKNVLDGRTAYFYDGLNGGFAFNAGSLVTNAHSPKTKFSDFDSVLGPDSFVSKKISKDVNFLFDRNKVGGLEKRMMAFISTSEVSSSYVGKNIHLQNSMSFAQRENDSIKAVRSDSPFSIPFLQASENGFSMGGKNKVGEGTLSFGLFEGKSSDHQLETSGFVSEYGREVGASYSSLFFGVTNESDGFLETSVEGAFAEESQARTTFAGVSSYGWLGKKWSYNALASYGSTKLDVNGVGLLRDVRSVESLSFAIEVARPLGNYNSNSIHIGLSQPLRVEQGNAEVMLPELYDIGGDLKFSSTSVDLSPSGRQIDLTVGYRANLNSSTVLSIQGAISQDYGHQKSDSHVAAGVASIKVKL